MKIKKLAIFLLFLIPILLVCNTAYAGWMQGKVLKATQAADGEIIIKFFRDSNQTEINALVNENLDRSSKNAILAIGLSAISLDATVDAFYDWGTKRFTALAIISP